MKMSPNDKEISIHELAKEMEAAGFTGQGMKNPEHVPSDERYGARAAIAGLDASCRSRIRLHHSRHI